MAKSATHRFGQIIGQLVEQSLRQPLEAIAKKHGLYLDYKHARPIRGGKRKASWKDWRGNIHDLDYVLEAGGAEESQGRPKAFIEIAYRRYTKHSRNKAQEIQGAIAPLAETYKDDHPFLGAVLAGVFTKASLVQLRSHGFGVLYLPFASIVAAFKKVGIDAHFDEDSADRDVQAKVDACDKLAPAAWKKIVEALRKRHRKDFERFFHDLEVSLTRSIASVRVLALHGRPCEVATVEEAIRFIEAYDESHGASEFVRYEVSVYYTNGDEIRGTFETKTEAIRFLRAIR